TAMALSSSWNRLLISRVTVGCRVGRISRSTTTTHCLQQQQQQLQPGHVPCTSSNNQQASFWLNCQSSTRYCVPVAVVNTIDLTETVSVVCAEAVSINNTDSESTFHFHRILSVLSLIFGTTCVGRGRQNETNMSETLKTASDDNNVTPSKAGFKDSDNLHSGHEENGDYENKKEQKFNKPGHSDCRSISDIQTWPEYFKTCFHKKSDGEKHVTGRSAADNRYKVNDVINEKVSLHKGDITKLKIDVIVNAANSSLLGGGGVDGAIHRAAGDELKEKCKSLNGCRTGDIVKTDGYRLPAKYIIHTVGPMGEKSDELRSCYEKSLNSLLKDERTIAFPCISTGIYGYPNDKAAEVSLETVRNWMESNHNRVDRIIFCIFMPKDVEIYREKMQKYFPLNEPKIAATNEAEEDGNNSCVVSSLSKSASFTSQQSS
ncbi:hypothetical protein Ahia01_000261800, partial [Argonauta hians]